MIRRAFGGKCGTARTPDDAAEACGQRVLRAKPPRLSVPPVRKCRRVTWSGSCGWSENGRGLSPLVAGTTVAVVAEQTGTVPFSAGRFRESDSLAFIGLPRSDGGVEVEDGIGG